MRPRRPPTGWGRRPTVDRRTHRPDRAGRRRGRRPCRGPTGGPVDRPDTPRRGPVRGSRDSREGSRSRCEREGIEARTPRDRPSERRPFGRFAMRVRGSEWCRSQAASTGRHPAPDSRAIPPNSPDFAPPPRFARRGRLRSATAVRCANGSGEWSSRRVRPTADPECRSAAAGFQRHGLGIRDRLRSVRGGIDGRVGYARDLAPLRAVS